MSDLGAFLQQLGNFAFMLAFWVAVVVGTFDATRKLAAFGRSQRVWLYASGYVLVSALVGGMYFWIHQKEVGLVAGLEFRHKPLPEDWAKGQSTNARHEGSKAYATAAFRGEGVLLKHLDASGNWVEFRPTAKDIAQRDAAVAVTTRLAEQSQMFWRLALEWWLGCIIAAAMGFIVGRTAKAAAANSTAESDARKSGARGSP